MVNRNYIFNTSPVPAKHLTIIQASMIQQIFAAVAFKLLNITFLYEL